MAFCLHHRQSCYGASTEWTNWWSETGCGGVGLVVAT